MSWLIYKHTNKINGKCYIGQTKQAAGIRWANGNGYKNYADENSCVFYNAIRKYGWENFEHTILEENIETQELANERESFWINFYKSYLGFDDCNGYNMTLGGSSGDHLGNSVYQISKSDLSIVAKYASSAEASRYFGSQANDSHIRRCCEGLKPSCKGFYWCYVKDYTNDWKPKRNELVSPIFQIDDDLNVVRRFNSITECVKLTGFSSGSIISCCKRKQRKANGYFWCYEVDYIKDWQPTIVKFNRNEKVYCFETNTTYPSAKEASLKTGSNQSHILRCCHGLENGTNGLHFCYNKDKNHYACHKTNKKPDTFSEKENELIISLYPLLGLSDEFVNHFPNRSRHGLAQQAHRLGLKYVGENKHRKKVINIELNKVFDSMGEAASYVGLNDGSSIGQCCLGTKKRAAGYHWMYYEDYLKHGFTNNDKRQSYKRKVLCIETQEIFNSIREAALNKNVNESNISSCCRTQTKTTKGLHWRYLEDTLDNDNQ